MLKILANPSSPEHVLDIDLFPPSSSINICLLKIPPGIQEFDFINSMKTIGQRCEFVTSDYREKVLQALDFRNRFAERPFVCQSLIQDDQIMALYAKITNVAWPKGTEHSNFEYMMDGGVRLISEDEYASIMLSPHKQDFTVCYLCGISPDSPRQKLHTNKHQQTKSASIDCLKKCELEPDKCHNSQK
ncbi:unnamed protein product [Mytilus edulis]|uniref:Uncharacterized protein n=1 Tax=Mytilus edulis TaxID=6550 RepID=A0A8S3RGY6_MYTED|nr:unnamed protein product [Mytilus edulis]